MGGPKLDEQCGSVRLRQAQFGTSFCNAEKREEQAPWCAEMSPWRSADGQEARTWLGVFCHAVRDILPLLPAGGSGHPSAADKPEQSRSPLWHQKDCFLAHLACF